MIYIHGATLFLNYLNLSVNFIIMCEKTLNAK